MEGEVYIFGVVWEDFLIMVVDIVQVIFKDLLLCKVYQYIMNGWFEICDDVELKLFYNRRNELLCE